MNAPLNPIEAHEQTLARIFSDAYAFEIPPYQRPYAWELEQARQLLSDLVEEMDKPNASAGMYFLGSVVLIKPPADPKSQVVDGQQRLTTLTILLSVLRDLTRDPEQRSARAQFVLQKANSDLGTDQRCRLLLRREDQAFFEKCIQEPKGTDNLPDPKLLQGSQQRIAENARHLRETLESLDETRRNRLTAFVLQRCYLVVVAVPTPESARRIFTVLNARGMDLTPTDILKADLLERVASHRQREVAERWAAAENALGRDGMVELFGHIRMMYERDKPRLSLETAFPKVVGPFRGAGEGFLTDVLEPVSDAAVLLTETKRVGARFGSEVAKAVRSLQRIDNKDWLPPALLRLWKSKPGEDAAIAGFLIQLERVAYFMFVNRQGINDRIARFAAVMDELEPRADKGPPPVGVEISNAEKTEFRKELNGPLYLKSRVCKAVLQRLDEALSSGGASYDELISIEHVLPQTVDPGSEWARWVPLPAQRDEWTHRLANLVLLTRRINTRASNWDFDRKKREYFASEDGRSPFPLTQTVLQAEQWSVDHLLERQEKLIQRLAQVWQL
jgi:hypothetical protein